MSVYIYMYIHMFIKVWVSWCPHPDPMITTISFIHIIVLVLIFMISVFDAPTSMLLPIIVPNMSRPGLIELQFGVEFSYSWFRASSARSNANSSGRERISALRP